MKTRRFIPPFEAIDEPHPGTPDNAIPKIRLEGRIVARRGLSDKACPYESGKLVNNHRVQWMLGYYDVGLERFFRAPDSGLACDKEGVR
jgi:hypothetical protein